MARKGRQDLEILGGGGRALEGSGSPKVGGRAWRSFVKVGGASVALGRGVAGVGKREEVSWRLLECRGRGGEKRMTARIFVYALIPC